MAKIQLHSVKEQKETQSFTEDELNNFIHELGGICQRFKKSYPVVWSLIKNQYGLSDYSCDNKSLPQDLFEKKVELEIEIRNRQKKW